MRSPAPPAPGWPSPTHANGQRTATPDADDHVDRHAPFADPAYATHRACLVELAGPLTALAGALRAALAACGRFLVATDVVMEG